MQWNKFLSGSESIIGWERIAFKWTHDKCTEMSEKLSWKGEALSVYAGDRRDGCQGSRLDASFSSHYGHWLIGPGGGLGGPRWRFNQRLRVSQHLASSCFTGPPHSRKVSNVSPPHTRVSLESRMRSRTCTHAGLKFRVVECHRFNCGF